MLGAGLPTSSDSPSTSSLLFLCPAGEALLSRWTRLGLPTAGMPGAHPTVHSVAGNGEGGHPLACGLAMERLSSKPSRGPARVNPWRTQRCCSRPLSLPSARVNKQYAHGIALCTSLCGRHPPAGQCGHPNGLRCDWPVGGDGRRGGASRSDGGCCYGSQIVNVVLQYQNGFGSSSSRIGVPLLKRYPLIPISRFLVFPWGVPLQEDHLTPEWLASLTAEIQSAPLLLLDANLATEVLSLASHGTPPRSHPATRQYVLFCSVLFVLNCSLKALRLLWARLTALQ